MFEFLIPVSFFFLIGFTFWVAITGWQRSRRVKLVVDFNMRLLDRLGSVKDFGEFLQTESGATFLRSFATESPVTSPQQRILRAAQVGIVLLSVGIGILMSTRLHAFTNTEDVRSALLLIGMVVTSLGVGYLVSCAVSYRLATALGVLGKQATQGRHELA